MVALLICRLGGSRVGGRGLRGVLSCMLRSRIGLVLLEVIRVAVVNHRPLRGRVLNWRWRIGVFDGVQHSVEEMRTDSNVTRANLRHGFLGRIFALNLLSFGLLWFCPVSHQDTIAEPFLFRSFQRS